MAENKQKMTLAEQQLAEEKMRQDKLADILLLFNHLAASQEVTVKLILERLYDIGASNIAYKRIRSRLLRIIFRRIARLSKPAFRQLGFYWFKKNCPRLITNWLVEQVSFDPPAVKKIQLEEESLAVLPPPDYQIEVRRLRSQVRVLTGIIILMTTVLGGGLFWLNHTYDFKPWQLSEMMKLMETQEKNLNE